MRLLAIALLVSITFVSYLERSNLSITAEVMMPELGISKEGMGWIFNAFLLGYGLFQVPAGWLGDRLGARLVLGWTTVACGVLTALTGALPGAVLLTGVGVLLTLCGLRFLLGTAEAAAFPVATQAVSLLMPPERRGLGNGAVLMGSSIGSALAAPFISWAVVHFGWRNAFYVSSVAAFVVGFTWLAFRSGSPAGGKRQAELAVPPQADTETDPRWLNLEVVLLALSYFAEGYLLFTFISWLYIYLVEVRHFSLMHGGFIASLPWIAALAATPSGGLLGDVLSTRFGRVRAAQALISVGYALSGSLLLAASVTSSRLLAVLSLCLSLAALYIAESSFWTVANLLGGSRGGVVSGFMNMIGIAGGIASNALVPLLVTHAGWRTAFASGTAMGFTTALLWIVLAKRLLRQRSGSLAKQRQPPEFA